MVIKKRPSRKEYFGDENQERVISKEKRKRIQRKYDRDMVNWESKFNVRYGKD